MTGPVVKAGDADFPGWAEGYWAVRQLDAPQWLTWGPLTLNRSRIAIATEWGPGEHW